MEDIKKLDEVLRKFQTTYQTTHVINRGIGPLSLLGVALVVLKTMGYISISWFWVLAPFWLPIVLALFLVFVILLGVAVLVHKGAEITVEKEKEIDDTPTEETTIETPVESAPTPAKPRRRRPKKKKEEVNNGESKESTDTRAETDTNK